MVCFFKYNILNICVSQTARIFVLSINFKRIKRSKNILKFVETVCKQTQETRSEPIFAHLANNSILAKRDTIWKRSCSRVKPLLVGRIYYQQVEFILASDQLPSVLLIPGDRSPEDNTVFWSCKYTLTQILKYCTPNIQDQMMSLFQMRLRLQSQKSLGSYFRSCAGYNYITITMFLPQ